MTISCSSSFANWLALQLAPTLLGSKNGTLLTFQNVPGQRLLANWRQCGELLLSDGPLAFISLKSLPERETVLFYRPDRLQQLLRQRKQRDFLARRGYPVDQGVTALLAYLRQRFQTHCPHEIGLFLGIPLEDVIGFIESRCPLENCALPWKVFGRRERSLRIWHRFIADQEHIDRLLRYGHQPESILCLHCPHWAPNQFAASS